MTETRRKPGPTERTLKDLRVHIWAATLTAGFLISCVIMLRG